MSDNVPTEIPYRGFVIYLSERLGTVEGFAVWRDAGRVHSEPPLTPVQTPQVSGHAYAGDYTIQEMAQRVIVNVKDLVDRWHAHAACLR